MPWVRICSRRLELARVPHRRPHVRRVETHARSGPRAPYLSTVRARTSRTRLTLTYAAAPVQGLRVWKVGGELTEAPTCRRLDDDRRRRGGQLDQRRDISAELGAAPRAAVCRFLRPARRHFSSAARPAGWRRGRRRHHARGATRCALACRTLPAPPVAVARDRSRVPPERVQEAGWWPRATVQTCVQRDPVASSRRRWSLRALTPRVRDEHNACSVGATGRVHVVSMSLRGCICPRQERYMT